MKFVPKTDPAPSEFNFLGRVEGGIGWVVIRYDAFFEEGKLYVLFEN